MYSTLPLEPVRVYYYDCVETIHKCKFNLQSIGVGTVVIPQSTEVKGPTTIKSALTMLPVTRGESLTKRMLLSMYIR